MRHVDVEQRQKKILCAIVDSYIETAIPVGSRAISQRFRHSTSSATIRNVMADLEEMGLITHPHTSAGRIPTDKGYRLYVDFLLEPRYLTKEEEAIIVKLLNKGRDDIESLMQSVSRAISVITNIAGVVLTPRLKRSVFKRIEFIPINSSRVLVVIMTGTGIVKNSIMDLEEEITRAEFIRISEFLNQELEGMYLGEIRNYLTQRLFEQSDSFYNFLKKAILMLSIPTLLKMDDRVYFEGATGIMSLPEFRDVTRLRLFLKAFEDKQDILDLLNEDMESEGVKVHIGKENACRYIQNCAIVTCNYKVKDNTIGILGAIGPTRMEYGKVMSAVSFLSEALGKVLESRG